jgi:hypothetical protein
MKPSNVTCFLPLHCRGLSCINSPTTIGIPRDPKGKAKREWDKIHQTLIPFVTNKDNLLGPSRIKMDCDIFAEKVTIKVSLMKKLTYSSIHQVMCASIYSSEK